MSEESTNVEVEQEPQQPVKSNFIDFDALPEEHRDVVKSRIGEDHRKLRERESELKKERDRAKELEKQLYELKKPREVQKPSEDQFISDPEGAAKQLDEWEAYIKQNQEYEFEQRQRTEREKQESLREQQERIGRFHERAKNSGVDQDKLGIAMQAVVDTLPEGMQEYLADHEYGPNIIASFYDNPMEMRKLASLSTYEAGVKLDRMAQAFKPSVTSNAPPPDDPVKGAPGSADKWGPQGATYE